MPRSLTYSILVAGWLFAAGFGPVLAQNKPDTTIRSASPVIIETGFAGSPQQWGGQVGIGRWLSETERHRLKRSGRDKVIFKDRIVSGNVGFYYQQYLHTNVFLTADYAIIRRHRSGFYRQFTPYAGISRTFLNSATYIVDNNGSVTLDKTAGDWRVLVGFTWGIGKRFNLPNKPWLRDVSLSVNVPFFYPNFQSVVLKPSVQVGVGFNLTSRRYTFSKLVKIIRK
jgi:hypothetical protein